MKCCSFISLTIIVALVSLAATQTVAKTGFAVGGGFGYARGTGDLDDLEGYLIPLIGEYELSSTFALRTYFGRSSIDYGCDSGYFCTTSIEHTYLTINGVAYARPFYATAGLGYYDTRIEHECKLFGDCLVDDDLRDPGVNIGAGLDFPVGSSRTVHLFTEVTFHHILLYDRDLGEDLEDGELFATGGLKLHF
ncbi:MAG: outer membrane beta-barrel protein [Candidatus Schekmanbacteria bacterium]|nr:outer membrane beta-barrel protein [Candidatus Schekmanbacteria bacterium]